MSSVDHKIWIAQAHILAADCDYLIYGDIYMYAAITTVNFLPGKAEAGSELFGSLVMPAYAEHVARGAWIFTHPEDNRAIAIVLYDSREAAEAGEEKEAVEQVMQAHCNMLAEPPRR